MTEEYTLQQFREVVAEMTAEPDSQLGQDEIHNSPSAHVVEIWQDMEITSTKNGDLYRQRTLHPKQKPLLPQTVRLFDQDGTGDTRRVVIHDELLDMMENITVEISPLHQTREIKVVVDEQA